MLSFNSKNIIAAVLFLTVTMLSIFVISCQKELSGNGFNITETLPDLTTRINSSVSGFVTDENDAAVEGATVVAGTSNTTTDKYGYFEMKNVSVVKNAALVTINKTGYFKGIKTYTATESKSGYFRIKLLPKTMAGNFSATAGGVVSLTNGLSINFPANAIVVAAAPGTVYTGQVNVAAQWINPAAADLHRTMPGDLRGLDSDGFMKLLTTYGMAAVELTGAAGELLQIATGKKATLTFPISGSILSSAPANIPLWSLDETNGLWRQEGSAVKTGNTYVGDVSHFSFWNCDVPNNYVQFNCTLQSANGQPISQALVKVSVVGHSEQAGYGYTDSTGYTGGAVPNSAQLLLEVFTDYTCGTALYSQNFTTGTTTAALGTIVIPSIATATVTGNVTCSGNPVTDGYVIMRKGTATYRFSISSDGSFSFNTVLCGANTDVSFIAEDIASQQAGDPLTYTLVTGANAIGTLSGCGTLIAEYMNYSINGTPYSLTAPVDFLSMQGNNQSVPPLIFISGSTGSGTTNSNYVNFSFTQDAIAAGSTQTLQSFSSRQLSDSVSSTPASPVNITEYGAVGQYITGNFTTTLTGAPPANTPYNITCTFRVKEINTSNSPA